MITRNHSTQLIWFLSFVTFCGLGHSQAIAANPSNKKFDDGIAIHGKAYADALASQAQALYETANAEILQFVKAVQDNKVARLNWKSLGANDVHIGQLRRLGEQLEILGETAGLDYRLRADALMKTSGDIIDAFRATPESQKQLDPVRLQLARTAPDRDREAEKLVKLATEGKWEAAEAELYRYFDQLGVATACLFNPEQIPIYKPFDQVRAAIDAAMRRARSAKAKQLLTERRQAEAPDFTSLLRETAAAAASLATSGTVALDGATLTGPEAIGKFGERWAEIQVRAIHCQALDGLLAGSSGAYDGAGIAPAGPAAATAANGGAIAAEFAKFNQEMMQALARLIEADAQRVGGPDAVRLYVEYLRASAPLVRRSANRRLGSVLDPALRSLAARAPQFPVEVAAYAEATDDLLRWRGRVAQSLAAARAEDFPAIDGLMFEATRSGSGYTGLYPEQNAVPEVAALLASAPQVMPRPIELLQGKQAHAVDVVRLANNGPVAVARFLVRSYVNVPAPLDLAAETDALKFDLMVTDDLPAISLSAAMAIDSAERGDLAAVGGTIANQYLESMATRFAALPTVASILTPLGTMPSGSPGQFRVDQVLMRFDLTPSWAQHDFFFVELTPPETPAE